MYLVYNTYYDSDFDTQASYYILGLYDNEEKAKKTCQANLFSQYKKIEANEELFLRL